MNHKLITLDDLIRKKDEIKSGKRRKTAQIYVKSLDGVITIKEPDIDTMQDAVKMEENGDAYMVLQCCISPNLKDPALLEAYGVIEPMDMVRLIFATGEISPIAIECLHLAGYEEGNVKLVDSVKN